MNYIISNNKNFNNSRQLRKSQLYEIKIGSKRNDNYHYEPMLLLNKYYIMNIVNKKKYIACRALYRVYTNEQLCFNMLYDVYEYV